MDKSCNFTLQKGKKQRVLVSAMQIFRELIYGVAIYFGIGMELAE